MNFPISFSFFLFLVSLCFASFDRPAFETLLDTNAAAALKIIRTCGITMLGPFAGHFVHALIRHKALDTLQQIEDPVFWTEWVSSKYYEFLRLKIFSAQLSTQIALTRDQITNGSMDPLALPKLLSLWTDFSYATRDATIADLPSDVFGDLTRNYLTLEDQLSLSQVNFELYERLKQPLRDLLMRLQQGNVWRLSISKIFKAYLRRNFCPLKPQLMQILNLHPQFKKFSPIIQRDNGSCHEFDDISFSLSGLSWSLCTGLAHLHSPLIRAVLYDLHPDLIVILIERFSEFMMYQWTHDDTKFIIKKLGDLGKYRRVLKRVFDMAPIDVEDILWASQDKRMSEDLIGRMIRRANFCYLNQPDLYSLITCISDRSQLDELLGYLLPSGRRLTIDHLLHCFKLGIDYEKMLNLLTNYNVDFRQGAKKEFLTALLGVGPGKINEFIIEGILRSMRNHVKFSPSHHQLAVQLGYSERIINLLNN